MALTIRPKRATAPPPVGAAPASGITLTQALTGLWLNRDAPLNLVTGELAVRAGTTVVGYADGGLKFNGSSSGAVTLRSAPILAGSSSFSITALVLMAANGAIYCERGSTGNAILKLETTITGAARFTYRNDGGTLLQISGGTDMSRQPPFLPWFVVTLVKNGAAVTLWQNHVQVTSGTWSSNDTLTATNIVTRLGSDAGDATIPASGSIGTVAVWKRALSTAEVLHLAVNPWSVFAPQVPRQRYFGSVAATGSVTAPAAAVTFTATAGTITTATSLTATSAATTYAATAGTLTTATSLTAAAAAVTFDTTAGSIGAATSITAGAAGITFSASAGLFTAAATVVGPAAGVAFTATTGAIVAFTSVTAPAADVAFTATAGSVLGVTTPGRLVASSSTTTLRAGSTATTLRPSSSSATLRPS